MGQTYSSQACQTGSTILTINQTDIIFNFSSCRSETPPVYTKIQFVGDLQSFKGKTLNYHIHQAPQINNNCSTTLGHYDPLKVNRAPSKPYRCSKEDFYTCEKGDLSGKFGGLNFSENGINYIDNSLSLSEILGLSIVIHAPDNTRVSCNNIELI